MIRSRQDRFPRVVVSISLGLALCLPGCALFSDPIPNLSFEPNRNIEDSLDIVSIDGGKVIQRKGNRITTSVGPGLARIDFAIGDGSRRSGFICEVEVGSGIKNTYWGLFSVLSTDGSLWIPRKQGDTFVVHGEHASGDFLFGTSKSQLFFQDGDFKIRKVRPNTLAEFTTENVSVACQGKSNTSLTLLDSGLLFTHPVPITLQARKGTHFLLSTGGSERRIELIDGDSRKLELGKGSTTIRWFLPENVEPEIEVAIDGDKTDSILHLSFSSGNPVKVVPAP